MLRRKGWRRRSSMGILKDFLRLRKQSDRVKIMFVLGIIALVLLISIIKDVVTVYNYVNSPTEYELYGNLSSNIKLNELSQLEQVDMISLQADSSVRLRYKMKETDVSYISVSKEYASYVYGIENNKSMLMLYANKLAYKQMLKDLQIDSYYDSAVYESREILLDYKGEDDKYTSAKVILVEELDNDRPIIFSVENNATLKAKAAKLRAYVSKQDMELMFVKELEGRGYSLCDREGIIEFQNALNVLLLKFRYHLIIFLMSILWILTLHRYRKI